MASGSGAGTAVEEERHKDDSQPLDLTVAQLRADTPSYPQDCRGLGSLKKSGTLRLTRGRGVRCKLSSVLFCDVDKVI